MRDSPEAVIFDIKHYAIHDGPGIRTTVFFKGCPLKCGWCHNPEGINPVPEIFLHSSRCDEGCHSCLEDCPQGALTKPSHSQISIDRTKCNLCGLCESVCSFSALELVGKKMTVSEILREIEKDRIFYEESGGGVTLSGGEPFSDPVFLKDLLDRLSSKNIHVVIDTSGFFIYEKFSHLIEKVDTFLFDIKIMDPQKHKKYTGRSNELIHDNLRNITKAGKPVAARIPLISDINDDAKNIKDTCDFLHKLDNIIRVHILPYHKGGETKHKRLGRQESKNTFKAPSEEKIEALKKIISGYGFSVKVGG